MRTDVIFVSDGLTLAGHLHTPDARAGHPLPAIVIIHPWGGVRKQTAGLYARRLTEHGFIALAFDAAHQGASEGEPHFLENPVQRAEDIKSATSYLSTRKDVDIGSLLRDGLGGGQDPAVFRDLVARAGLLRTDEAFGEPTLLEHIVPEEVDETTPDHLRQGHEYYRTARGAHLRSENAWVLRGVDQIALYDSFAGIGSLAPRPLLMIAGSEAATAHFSRTASNGPGNRRSCSGSTAPPTSTCTTRTNASPPPSPNSPRSSVSTDPAPGRRPGSLKSPRTHARSTTPCPNGRSSRRRPSRSSPPSSRR